MKKAISSIGTRTVSFDFAAQMADHCPRFRRSRYCSAIR